MLLVTYKNLTLSPARTPFMEKPLFNLNASLALAVALVNFVFCVLILARTARTAVYKTFFFFCVFAILWNLGDFMTHYLGRGAWFYISLFGSGMLPAVVFHFVNALVGSGKSGGYWVEVAYGFSGFLALSSLASLVNADARAFVDSIYWNVLYFALLVPFLLYAIAILAGAIRRASDKDEKRRLGYVLAAIVIGVFTGLTDLVQIMHIPIPPLGHVGGMAYSVILATGVFKHRAQYDLVTQMKAKLDMLDEIASGIVHEVQNPLGAIKGALKLLESEPEGSPRSREYIELLEEEVDRLGEVLQSYRSLARPLKLDIERCPINVVIMKTVRMAEAGFPEMRISLALAEGLPDVLADASSIKQVALNLIKNASEASGPGGELVIATEHERPWVKVIFTDNGHGLPKEDMGKVFEPFFTTKAGGIGVGLSICRRIIEAHNGKMEAENVTPRGARFSIFLPYSI